MESNNPVKSKIESFFQKFIKIISILILIGLSYNSIVGTVYIGAEESAVYTDDSVISNLLWCLSMSLLFTLFIYLIKKHRLNNSNNKPSPSKNCLLLISVILIWIMLLSFSIVWVVISKVEPLGAGDSKLCFNDAVSFRLGDYSSLSPGGYLNRCINQLGFVWFVRYLMVIFNTNTILSLQIINAIAISVFYIYLGLIFTFKICNSNCKLLFFDILFITGILFTPLIYLCSQFYGNILGLTLGTMAIYYEIKFYDNPKPYYYIVCLLCVTFSIIIKMNYYIFAIGMVIYGIIKCFSGNQIIADNLSALKIKSIKASLPILIIVFSILQSVMLVSYTEKKSNVDLSDSGYSYLSHIVMGLQESDGFNPGWWNGYNNNSYTASGFSNSRHKEISHDALLSRIDYLVTHSKESFDFFKKKIETQWNVPEFQMDFYNINHYGENSILNQHAYGSGYQPYWYSYSQSKFINVFHSLVLIGALLSLLLSFNKNSESIILLLIFIGGFTFHLFWEAKAVFALPYFALLLPFAIDGYYSLSKRILLLIPSNSQ